MIKEVGFNPIQSAEIILAPKATFLVAGRNFGKSTLFGNKMRQVAQKLPGASGIIAAKNYSHILTSVLPSAFAFLERLGYHRGIHYVIGPPPKEWEMKMPFHAPVRKYDNYITFFGKERCTGFYLVSFDKGSGRGPNCDFLLSDETLLIDPDKLNKELRPTIRANKDRFQGIPMHLGEYHSTSMPYTIEGRWILEKGNYYLEDYGIDIFSYWKQVTDLQIELIDAEEPAEAMKIYNEIQAIRRIIKPRLSRVNRELFLLGNCLDNMQFDGGLSYARKQRDGLPYLVFLVEIMNAIMDLTSDRFYSSFSEDRHVVNDGLAEDYIADLAFSSNFDWGKLSSKNCLFFNRKYYTTSEPINISMDWQGSIIFWLVWQYNQATNTLTFLKEVFVTPEPGKYMVAEIVKSFNDFFQFHGCRRLNVIKDSFADSKFTAINTGVTINDTMVDALTAKNWDVNVVAHGYREPPMHEKWMIIMRCMAEQGEDIKIRIVREECKYLILALNRTRQYEAGGEMKKDKRDERKKNVKQETTTHSTDALDKAIYYLHHSKTTSQVDRIFPV